MPCEYILSMKCSKGHVKSWMCHKKPSTKCEQCERDTRNEERKKKKALERQEKREREEREHAREMERLTEQVELVSQTLRDQQLSDERQSALLQKRKDLENASIQVMRKPQPQVSIPTSPPKAVKAMPKESQTNLSKSTGLSAKSNPSIDAPDHHRSLSEQEWERQKLVENADNSAIDSVMEMTGLEDVKAQILRIKAKIDVNRRQGSSIKEERFNISLLGNPGTGKSQ